jgi:serine/threonine-protein kinase
LNARATIEAPVIRANFDLPPNARVNDMITGSTIAVSPRGDMIAFTSIGVSGFRMYVRRVNEIAAREVADANIAGRNLTFSPDGRWLAFTEGNVLRKVAVDGGQVVTVATSGSAVPYGLTWSATDTIYIGGFSGLWAVPQTGGTPTLVGLADSASVRLGRRWPLVLPDGKAIVYASGNSSSATPRLSVLEIGSGRFTELDLVAAMPLGMIDDRLVYVSPTGGLMAVRFDLGTHKPVGQPVQLEESVLVDPTAGAKASLSASGTLAYLRGRAQFQPVVTGAGSAPPTPLIREPGTYSTPRFSPDGRRVAITMFGTNATDIWIYDVARNTFTRLTTEGMNVRPEWTPDGRQVIFISTRAGKTGIWRQPIDGSGPAELLYEPEVEPFEAIMSPDAQWLVVRTAPGAKYSRDILSVRLDSTRTVIPLVTGPYTESLPRLSPDGKWLVYQSNETDRFEIYVRPFPGSGARVQVSDKGGTEPIWARDGRSLYYRGPVGDVIKVGVTTGASFSIGAQSVALTGDYLTDSSHPNWDVAPDGRLLMLKRAGAEAQTIVVHNWARELREKTAAR